MIFYDGVYDQMTLPTFMTFMIFTTFIMMITPIMVGIKASYLSGKS